MLKEYTKIRLKTGEIGHIVEVYHKSGTYLVEFPPKNHSLDLRDIHPEDIAEVL